MEERRDYASHGTAVASGVGEQPVSGDGFWCDDPFALSDGVAREPLERPMPWMNPRYWSEVARTSVAAREGGSTSPSLCTVEPEPEGDLSESEGSRESVQFEVPMLLMDVTGDMESYQYWSAELPDREAEPGHRDAPPEALRSGTETDDESVGFEESESEESEQEASEETDSCEPRESVDQCNEDAVSSAQLASDSLEPSSDDQDPMDQRVESDEVTGEGRQETESGSRLVAKKQEPASNGQSPRSRSEERRGGRIVWSAFPNLQRR